MAIDWQRAATVFVAASLLLVVGVAGAAALWEYDSIECDAVTLGPYSLLESCDPENAIQEALDADDDNDGYWMFDSGETKVTQFNTTLHNDANGYEEVLYTDAETLMAKKITNGTDKSTARQEVHEYIENKTAKKQRWILFNARDPINQFAAATNVSGGDVVDPGAATSYQATVSNKSVTLYNNETANASVIVDSSPSHWFPVSLGTETNTKIEHQATFDSAYDAIKVSDSWTDDYNRYATIADSVKGDIDTLVNNLDGDEWSDLEAEDIISPTTCGSRFDGSADAGYAVCWLSGQNKSVNTSGVATIEISNGTQYRGILALDADATSEIPAAANASNATAASLVEGDSYDMSNDYNGSIWLTKVDGSGEFLSFSDTTVEVVEIEGLDRLDFYGNDLGALDANTTSYSVESYLNDTQRARDLDESSSGGGGLPGGSTAALVVAALAGAYLLAGRAGGGGGKGSTVIFGGSGGRGR